MRILFSFMFLVIFPANAFAGCCGYGCCDCSCVAVHIQRADLIERFMEIKNGYGYKEEEIVISFPATEDKYANELIALNSAVNHLNIKCDVMTNGNDKLISCTID